MGKTAAIIISWLFKRAHGDKNTPARLVYCLPMRVLVEQTVKVAGQWVDALSDSGLVTNKPGIHILMGGEGATDWDNFPDKDMILVGTQDQLLSRALNRGYAMSRFRWPVHFGLLNNDCLWVMDEVQLMGAGLETTAQLQALRHRLGTVLPVKSIWCSATLHRDWLNTVDFSPYVAELKAFELGMSDLANEGLSKRRDARKSLGKCPVTINERSEFCSFVLDSHKESTRTLVIINAVSRAQYYYNELVQNKRKIPVILIHSRYRPMDRKKLLDKLLAPPPATGVICICTQVVEAGVDVSSGTLITELAPWPSLIQRFGRLNRYGEEVNATAYWVDIDLKKKSLTAPYDASDLEEARNILAGLNDVGPSSLPEVTQKRPVRQVLRSVDLKDLFDTTNDLAGAEIDVSRFIRDSADTDVQVYWRAFEGETPEEDQCAPLREELCSVPIGGLANWLKKSSPAWTWDHLDKKWRRVPNSEKPIPGMVIMLRLRDGGYSSEIGWTGNRKDIPGILPLGKTVSEGYDDDQGVAAPWQSLAEHTDRVVSVLETVMARLGKAIAPWQDELVVAARWHDAGKVHPVFQMALTDLPNLGTVWAKAAKGNPCYSRRGFRHELASALIMLSQGHSDLSAYLAAAHHGKVRLSIRSLPGETKPSDPSIRFARGIWDGDCLPEVDLGGGTKMQAIELDLSVMELGHGKNGPSWASRVLALRDAPNVGPFRLAFLESLLRVADWNASKETPDA
jgi:CRISPR-associated endonuclease/helicase Cas3